MPAAYKAFLREVLRQRRYHQVRKASDWLIDTDRLALMAAREGRSDGCKICPMCCHCSSLPFAVGDVNTPRLHRY